MSRTSVLDRLQERLHDAGVEFFLARELLRPRLPELARQFGEEVVTVGKRLVFVASDEELDELVVVAKFADRIRREYGKPIAVKNGLRPRNYNRHVGSRDTSQHRLGRAIDLWPDGGWQPRELAVIARIAAGMWADCEFGGLGCYGDSVHIDTRTRGRGVQPFAWGSRLDEAVAELAAHDHQPGPVRWARMDRDARETLERRGIGPRQTAV